MENKPFFSDIRCLRRYPDGSISGDERNCLTLNVFTGSVVYEDLAPVVVYLSGDELTEEEEERVRPSSGLAVEHGVVFVEVNYRRGAVGFLSHNILSG